MKPHGTSDRPVIAHPEPLHTRRDALLKGGAGVVALSCLIQSHPFTAADARAEGDVKRGLVPQRIEQQQALKDLNVQYQAMRRELEVALENAVRKHRDDSRYMSPLHSAILSVEAWRVFEAESTLFSIIDYELDVRSFPNGLRVGGDYFFPAARTLTRLRVDTKKVLNAMVIMARDDRQLQLLTWVLFKRVQSVDEAGRILEAGGRNENFRRAVRMLDRSPDLLPSPTPR